MAIRSSDSEKAKFGGLSFGKKIEIKKNQHRSHWGCYRRFDNHSFMHFPAKLKKEIGLARACVDILVFAEKMNIRSWNSS